MARFQQLYNLDTALLGMHATDSQWRHRRITELVLRSGPGFFDDKQFIFYPDIYSPDDIANVYEIAFRAIKAGLTELDIPFQQGYYGGRYPYLLIFNQVLTDFINKNPSNILIDTCKKYFNNPLLLPKSNKAFVLKKCQEPEYQLDVPFSQWQEAKTHFGQNSDLIKISRKRTLGLTHSFIKIAGKIFALSRKSLGAGGNGRFKWMQDEEGNHFGLKIDANRLDQSMKATFVNLWEVGLLYGWTMRGFAKPQKMKLEEVCAKVWQKLYSVVSLSYPENFHTVWNRNKHTYSVAVKKLIALRLALAVHKHNSHGLIHGDLKPKNIACSITPDRIRMKLIDIDFSICVPEGSWIQTSEHLYPQKFRAREGNYHGIKWYGYPSDVYALGGIYTDTFYDIPVLKNMGYSMQALNYRQRPNLTVIIKQLVESLKYERELNPDALRTIEKAKTIYLPSQSTPIPAMSIASSSSSQEEEFVPAKSMSGVTTTLRV